MSCGSRGAFAGGDFYVPPLEVIRCEAHRRGLQLEEEGLEVVPAAQAQEGLSGHARRVASSPPRGPSTGSPEPYPDATESSSGCFLLWDVASWYALATVRISVSLNGWAQNVMLVGVPSSLNPFGTARAGWVA